MLHLEKAGFIAATIFVIFFVNCGGGGLSSRSNTTGPADLTGVHMEASEPLKIPQPRLEECFQIEAMVDTPVVIGQDNIHGLRRLIPVTSGIVTGKLKGVVLPGGVDSQVVRPDGFTELSARYGIKLDDGTSVFIENNGIRRVDPKYAAEVAAGNIVDPKHVYFATVPKFEVYDESLRWLEQSIFICYATRLPDKVLLRFYQLH